MPGFCLHLISFQLLIGWQRLWSFLFLFSSFLNSSILRPSWWIFEMYFVWFFLCFWPSFQIIFTFPASAGWVKCEEFWSNEMVDKSMWFFFLLFHPFIHSSFIVLWFFFRLDFKKNCSFKSSFVDFFFVKLQVFVYFSLMRGILMISFYLLMFFRFFFIWGVRLLKFSIVYFLLMMFVEVEVEVEGLCEMFMFGITSEPCTGKFHGIFGMFLVYLMLLSTWRWLLLILHEFVELLLLVFSDVSVEYHSCSCFF